MATRDSKEERLQMSVCEYIRLQYPTVMFNVDLSGLRMTMPQACKAKRMRSERGFPDIMIYEAKKGYNGLFIEIKADGVNLYNKSGNFINKHIHEQSQVIFKLKQRGYLATFAIGFDECKKVIDNYLK